MKNYLTTVFGALTALGLYLKDSPNHTLSVIGNVLSVTGPLLLGGAAKDSANKN